MERDCYYIQIVFIGTDRGTDMEKTVVQRFLKEGAQVVINCKREEVLAEAAIKLDRTDANISHITEDKIQNKTSLEFVKHTPDTFGGVDSFLANEKNFYTTCLLGHYTKGFNSLYSCHLNWTTK